MVEYFLYQKTLLGFLFGIILTLAINQISPFKVTETKYIVADKGVVVDSGAVFKSPTVDIVKFIQRAERLSMKRTQFEDVMNKSGIDFETREYEDGFVWLEVYTDKGEYQVGFSRTGRCFNQWRSR